jgi:hypothetical protein
MKADKEKLQMQCASIGCWCLSDEQRLAVFGNVSLLAES